MLSQNVYNIELAWGRYWSSSFFIKFMDWAKGKVHKLARNNKTNNDQTS